MLFKWIEKNVMKHSQLLSISNETRDRLLIGIYNELNNSFGFFSRDDQYCMINLEEIASIFFIRSKKLTTITTTYGDEYIAKGILNNLVEHSLFTQITSTIFLNIDKIINFHSKFGIVYFENGFELPININSMKLMTILCGRDKDLYNNQDYSPKKATIRSNIFKSH